MKNCHQNSLLRRIVSEKKQIMLYELIIKHLFNNKRKKNPTKSKNVFMLTICDLKMSHLSKHKECWILRSKVLKFCSKIFFLNIHVHI